MKRGTLKCGVCGEWKKKTYKYMEKYFKRKKSKQ